MRGQGGLALFGLHQLRYYAGSYTSPTRNTFTSRATSPTIAGRYSLPAGTALTFTDVGSAAAGVARYRANLTPAEIKSVPFSFYTTPELYAVQLTYPVVTAGGAGSYTTPWDDDLLSCTVVKPFEWDGGTCTLQIRRDPAVQFTGDYRWRGVRVRLGYWDGSGETFVDAFSGYIRTVRAGQDESGTAWLELTADNASVRFKRAQWTAFDSVPLGGQTVNQALDDLLASEGLTAAYRTWHARGDAVFLPAGRPEDPFEWPKPGETKWETLQRIAGYADLEVVPTDTGAFLTLPKDYADAAVTQTWAAVPASDLKDLWQGGSLAYDAGEHATAVFVSGRGESGETLVAWAVDTAAETDPASSRFSPWRDQVQETVPGTPTGGMLVLRAQALAREGFWQKYELDLRAPVNLSLGRRNRVKLTGTTIGAADADEWVVLSLTHTYENDPSFARLKTTAGLRRLT